MSKNKNLRSVILLWNSFVYLCHDSLVCWPCLEKNLAYDFFSRRNILHADGVIQISYSYTKTRYIRESCIDCKSCIWEKIVSVSNENVEMIRENIQSLQSILKLGKKGKLWDADDRIKWPLRKEHIFST